MDDYPYYGHEDDYSSYDNDSYDFNPDDFESDYWEDASYSYIDRMDSYGYYHEARELKNREAGLYERYNTSDEKKNVDKKARVYWVKDMQRCPKCGHALRKSKQCAKLDKANDIKIPIYDCLLCCDRFLKYPGAEIAVTTNISTYYLSTEEKNKISKLKYAKVEALNHAAWQAKKDLDRRIKEQLEKQKKDEEEKKRLKEEKRKEAEAALRAEREERQRKLLDPYGDDRPSVIDFDLFTRATSILKKAYGEDAKFRPVQYEAIEQTINEKRHLVVQRTGWGKSLVYFICTKLLRDMGYGLTLVISPLLALMDNQLEQAHKFGLNCDAINSVTSGRRGNILEKMKGNYLDLVFTTPESLAKKEVRECLPNIQIGLLVIDEAHCISDWGHDFRLEYSKIYKLIEQLQPNVPVLATTATANDTVIADLTQQIGAHSISRGHLMRDNLSIQVLNMPEKETRYAWILDNLPKLQGTGIIYCISKKDCDWLSVFLNENGILAEPYYAGDKEQEQRNLKVLQRFLDNQIKVIVATIKLGMGFDKGDISFVIHFQCPKNVIAYYQQIGRAGRNIPFARTFLMMGAEDKKILSGFINYAFPSEKDMLEVRQYITEHWNSTKNKICLAIDIPKQRLKTVLEFLEYDGMITSQWKISSSGKYYQIYNSTPLPFFYRGDDYKKLKTVRNRELSQIFEIASTESCISRAVVKCLDDEPDHDCGVCANCNPEGRFPADVSAESREKANKFLLNLTIPINPWYYWPKNNLTDYENYYTNLPGIALSKYGEGLGRLVSKGKYETGRFDDVLVRKGVRVLKEYIKEYQITHITAVPSLNTDVVPDYAERLATACRLTYAPLIKKYKSLHQKDLGNASHQFKNAYASFKILPNVNIPKRIVLVDDMVDSGLTLAVCGALLIKNGAEAVFPLALADSSSGERDDTDE